MTLIKENRNNNKSQNVATTRGVPRGVPLTTHLVIHALSTVSHYTQQSQGLGEILDSLSFTGTSGPGRSSAQMHGQCLADTPTHITSMGIR